MLKILAVILFCWLLLKSAGLLFKVAWGAAKIISCLLFVVAIPLLIVCLLFAGGLVLLVPAALLAVAFGLLKTSL